MNSDIDLLPAAPHSSVRWEFWAFALSPVGFVSDVFTPLSSGVIAALLLCVAASLIDAREHRIPNTVTALLGVTAIFTWATAALPLVPLLQASVVGVCLFALNQLEQIGGGDVKMLPSLILIAGSLTADPAAAAMNVLVLLSVQFIVALLFALAARQKEVPLAVGAPLALTTVALLV